MAKTLVIAEKPSVAADIARALGKFKKEKDFFENDEYIISSAIGHLIEIDAPEEEQVKRGKWKLENLPVIPSHFELRPIERTEARLSLLKKLIKRKDVEAIVNACDAGREGELIFRYIMQYVGADKPIERLWLQSMTPQSIRDNFSRLRSNEEMLPLADAAVCRSEADWLIGINGTRALTSFNSQDGGFHKTTVGRVQTPTLFILVEREDKIRHFVPKPYWEVHAFFEAKAGVYPGRYFDESFKKPESAKESDQKPERIWEKAKAEAIVEACRGKQGIATEESKPATQLSPLLFDLTSLQREANSRFGFPANMTLSIAQSLYEKHKALTYPRTDSRYLPEDYIGTVKRVLKNLSDSILAPFASKILASDWVHPNKRIFNGAKVSDHFAIIPTGELPEKLSEPEQKIYDIVSRRFLAIFYPAAVYQVTTRITHVEVGELNHAFKTEGKVLKEPGWLEVYGKQEAVESDDAAPSLVPVEPSEKVQTKEIEIKELITRPPPRYTEATLLSAMEGAGKLVEDEELREAMSAKGLGTPATRAAIIEGLIFEKYVRREGRELVATAKAFGLIDTLRALEIAALSSPELTGEWEHKLKLIEQKKLSRPQFIQGIVEMTKHIVEHVRSFDSSKREIGKPSNLIDPFTQEPMLETLHDYRSKDGSLIIRKAIAGRTMDLSEVRELLEKKEIGPLDDFISRQGRPFSAKVRLTSDKKVELDWGASDRSEGEGESLDIDSLEVIGKCPKDGGRVVPYRGGFACEHAIAVAITAASGSSEGESKNETKAKSKAKTAAKETPAQGTKAACDFKLAAKILNQPIDALQVKKLLTEKKTDLMTGFISHKTKRPFKAYLILNEENKIGFEFPPREPSAKARSKKSE